MESKASPGALITCCSAISYNEEVMNYYFATVKLVNVYCNPYLEGSWVVISAVFSRVSIHIRGLITLLMTTHEPPSKPYTLSRTLPGFSFVEAPTSAERMLPVRPDAL